MNRVSRPTRVGFLCYGLDRPLSGVTRVAQELGSALLRRDDCAVTFLTPYRRGPFVDGAVADSVYLPGCRLLPGLMLLGGPLIALLARARGFDIVHDPVGVAPFTLGRWAGRFGRVVTLHDAIAFEYPEGYPWLNNLLHRTYVPATLRNVDRVATGSHESARTLVRFYPVRLGDISVVPNGVAAHFRPGAPAEVQALRERYGILGDYLLYVGAFQSRKNILGLLDAFAIALARLPTLRLVLVGPSLWSYPAVDERVSRPDVAGAVTRLGYVSDSELRALYAGTSAYVSPSLYEGFGLPVLEAMACGAPVICSTAGSLPEVAGDAALFVDARETHDIADAIVRLVTDRPLAEDLRARGLARARTFTWDRAAAEYAALYHRLRRA